MFRYLEPPRGPVAALAPDTRTYVFASCRRRQVLEDKLRYAIYNCRAVDADDTSVGRSAAGLGWGDDP